MRIVITHVESVIQRTVPIVCASFNANCVTNAPTQTIATTVILVKTSITVRIATFRLTYEDAKTALDAMDYPKKSITSLIKRFPKKSGKRKLDH